MKLPLLHTLTLLLTLSAAHARLGETEAQIAARYGAPVREQPPQGPRDKSRTYIFNGIKILVTFLDGISHNEHYMKTPYAPFSDAEIAALLRANSSAATWKLSPGATATRKEWRAYFNSNSETPDIIARYSSADSQPDLLIGTLKYILYCSRLRESQTKEKLNGF